MPGRTDQVTTASFQVVPRHGHGIGSHSLGTTLAAIPWVGLPSGDRRDCFNGGDMLPRASSRILTCIGGTRGEARAARAVWGDFAGGQKTPITSVRCGGRACPLRDSGAGGCGQPWGDARPAERCTRYGGAAAAIDRPQSPGPGCHPAGAVGADRGDVALPASRTRPSSRRPHFLGFPLPMCTERAVAVLARPANPLTVLAMDPTCPVQRAVQPASATCHQPCLGDWPRARLVLVRRPAAARRAGRPRGRRGRELAGSPGRTWPGDPR